MFGFGVSIIALAAGLFQYLPNMEEKKYYEEYLSQLQQVSNQKKKAFDRVLTSQKMVRASMDNWTAVTLTRTPPKSVAAGGIDLSVSPWQIAADGRTYRNSVQRLVNDRLKIGGVKLPNGGPFIQPLGEDQASVLASLNYPGYAFPVAVYELPNITVQGTYDQIIRNYKAWGNVPNYICTPDALQLNGTSPLLTATYNVIMVGYIRTTEIYPPAPDAVLAGGAAPAAAGAPAAAFGGAAPPAGTPGGAAPVRKGTLQGIAGGG